MCELRGDTKGCIQFTVPNKTNRTINLFPSKTLSFPISSIFSWANEGHDYSARGWRTLYHGGVGKEKKGKWNLRGKKGE